jgi:hypothetical protein
MDTNHVSDTSDDNSKHIAFRILRKFDQVSNHRNFRVLTVIQYECSVFRALIRHMKCVYVRKTNKMHAFLNNLFSLNYPRHISNK